MLRVMMDTNYWIDLKYSPELLSRFKRLASLDEIKVYFSYGNFIDLVQAEEQDELSAILAETVDTYIPAMEYRGDTYEYSENPVSLIPDDQARDAVRRATENVEETETLQYVFKGGDWDTDRPWFEDFTYQMKQVYDDFGLEYAMAHAFDDYLVDDGEKYRLDQQDVDIMEYVRKMATIQRIGMMKDNEKVDPHDLADMEICSQAILTSCDMLLIESKWRRLRLVRKITSKLDKDEPVEVFDEFEEFLRVLEVYSDKSR